MRDIATGLLALLLSSSLLAQGVPGTNLSVDVRVRGVTMRGDTSRIQYVLKNAADSREELFTYTVDAPAGVLSILRPEPREDWNTATSYRGRPVADWAVLGSAMGPGAQSPELSFEAVGLPGLVNAWVRGFSPPPPLTAADTNPAARPSDPLTQNSIRLTVVGVVPKLLQAAPDLLARLRGLTAQACGELHWITSQGVCNSLLTKVDHAVSSLGSGQLAGAVGQLASYRSELDAQHGAEPGKHISDAAYWLLRSNAEYLSTRLGGP